MKALDQAIKDIEQVGIGEGAEIQIEGGAPMVIRPREDTARGFQNISAIAGMLRQLGLVGGQTCFPEEFEIQVQADESAHEAGGSDGKEVSKESRPDEGHKSLHVINSLAAGFLAVLRKYSRLRDAVERREDGLGAFILAQIELAEENGYLSSAVKLQEDLVESLAGQNSKLANENSRLEVQNSDLQTTIRNQRLTIALLLGGLVGALGLGTTFACHQYGVLDKVFPSHKVQNERDTAQTENE